MLPFTTPPRHSVPPDVAPLREAGWSIQSLTGNYAVAFRGPAEVVFVWRGDGWHRLTTRALPDTSRQAA